MVLMEVVLTAGKYVSWGVVSLSVTNLAIILAMLVIFGLALALPFPSDRDRHREDPPAPGKEHGR